MSYKLQGVVYLFLLLSFTIAIDTSIHEDVSESPLASFSNNKVRIAHWTINGIRALVNKQALQNFIDAEKPDIL